MDKVFGIDRRLRFRRLWLSVGVVWLLAILVFSLTSTGYMPSAGHIDKLYHMISYGVLMGWWLQLFPHRLGRTGLALLFITFGAGIEVLQSFHPLRYFDVLDMAANTAGVMAAWGLGYTRLDQVLYWLESRIG